MDPASLATSYNDYAREIGQDQIDKYQHPQVADQLKSAFDYLKTKGSFKTIKVSFQITSNSSSYGDDVINYGTLGEYVE